MQQELFQPLYAKIAELETKINNVILKKNNNENLEKQLLQKIEDAGSASKINTWLVSQGTRDDSERNKKTQSEPLKTREQKSNLTFQAAKTLPFGGLFKYKPELPSSVSAQTCIGLDLYVKNNQVWVGTGTIAGQLPDGFNPTEGKLIASSGSGTAYAKVTINQLNAIITERSIVSLEDPPDNTNTEFYYALGYYEYVNTSPIVVNFACGSLGVTFCRNWFVAEPPFFTPTFTR